MKQTATLWAWTRRRAARRVPEAVVFSAATAVALLHALDDAFLHREPGVGLGQHALAAAVVARPRARRDLRLPLRCGPRRAPALALFFGALAIVNGMLHVKHIAAQGAAASDLTGVLAARRRRRARRPRRRDPVAAPRRGRGQPPPPLGLPHRRRARRAAARALHGRADRHGAHRDAQVPRGRSGRRPAPTTARWRSRPATASTSPAGTGRRTTARRSSSSTAAAATAPARSPTPSCSSATATASCCTTPAAAGRARAPRTRSAGAGPRTSPGRSRFLKSRPEVDPQRIGGLGLSTGADALVQAAGQGANLRAVVADGTAAESFEDWRRLQGITAMTPMFAAEFATVRITSGAKSGPPLEDMIKRVSDAAAARLRGPRRGVQVQRQVRPRGRQPPRRALEPPDAGHTAAIRDAAPEYERRVTAFFDRALSRGPG